MAQYLLSDGTADLYLLSERGYLKIHSKTILASRDTRKAEREFKPTTVPVQCSCNQGAEVSLTTDPLWGNCSRKRYLYGEEMPEIDKTPLPKRKHHTKVSDMYIYTQIRDLNYDVPLIDLHRPVDFSVVFFMFFLYSSSMMQPLISTCYTQIWRTSAYHQCLVTV